MTDKPDVAHQCRIAPDGEIEPDDHTGSDLSQWGMVDTDDQEPETKLDRPEGSLEADDRPEATRRDSGQQAGLFGPDGQRTLSGGDAGEKPRFETDEPPERIRGRVISCNACGSDRHIPPECVESFGWWSGTCVTCGSELRWEDGDGVTVVDEGRDGPDRSDDPAARLAAGWSHQAARLDRYAARESVEEWSDSWQCARAAARAYRRAAREIRGGGLLADVEALADAKTDQDATTAEARGERAAWKSIRGEIPAIELPLPEGAA